MNNNNLDALLKLIVPAIFLIVWAITQLFGREATQARPQPVPRGGGHRPPRPPAGPFDPDEMKEPRQPTMRWNDLNEAEQPFASASRKRTADDDDIVILGTETRPPRPTPHRPATRASSKSRSGQGGRRGSSAAARNVSTPRQESPAASTSDLGSLGSLVTTPLSPLALNDQDHPLVASKITDMPEQAVNQSAVAIGRIQTMLQSRERTREALVINELLRPPVSMRRAGRGKR